MQYHVYQTLDLFRAVFIQEDGIKELTLPDLEDLKNVCKTIIDKADKQELIWLQENHKRKEVSK